MTPDVWPAIFRGQDFEAVDIPESGSEFSEDARLRATPVFVYEAVFSQQGTQYEFSGTFLFNGVAPIHTGNEMVWQFEVTEEVPEDDAGTERTLTIQGAEGDPPFESFEIIPLDWEGRPIDFTQLEAGANQKKISYRMDGPPESLKLRLSGINVFDVETIAVRLSDPERQYPNEPPTPLIRREDAIRIDKLSNPTNEKRKIEEHLLALFDALSDKLTGHTFQLECSYQYQLAPDSLYASMPVTTVESVQWEAASFSALAGQLAQWRQTVQPAPGDFVLEVTLFGVNETELKPTLQLTQLLLSSDSLVDSD